MSASHHTPLDGSGVAPGGCPRISKGGSLFASSSSPPIRASLPRGPPHTQISSPAPSPAPPNLPDIPSQRTSTFQFISLCWFPVLCLHPFPETSSVLQWAFHSSLVKTSLLSPQFAHFPASSTIPPCPFVNHDQHTIPTLRFVFTSLPRLFLFHRHASLSFERSPSAFSGKHPPQNTNRDACQSIPCR